MGGEGKVEGSAAVGRSFGPNAAGMAFNDAADVSEADARAFEAFGVLEGVKDAEQLARLGHTEADPIISNEKDDFAGLILG